MFAEDETVVALREAGKSVAAFRLSELLDLGRLATRYLSDAPAVAAPQGGFPAAPESVQDNMVDCLYKECHGVEAARLAAAILDARTLLARIDLLDGRVMDTVTMAGFDRDWADGIVSGAVDEEEAERIMGAASHSFA
jgi:hypothetical protein